MPAQRLCRQHTNSSDRAAGNWAVSGGRARSDSARKCCALQMQIVLRTFVLRQPFRNVADGREALLLCSGAQRVALEHREAAETDLVGGTDVVVHSLAVVDGQSA